jgi:hypothetical protein
MCEHSHLVPAQTDSKYGRLTMGLGRSAGPCAPSACGFAPRGLCVINIPVVTLSLVEFQMFL